MRRVNSKRPRRLRKLVSNAAWGGFGLMLAGGAVAFPWYVYFNPEQFSPPRIEYSGNGELFGEPEDRSGAFEQRMISLRGEILDPVETGTVEPANISSGSSGDQPFPGRSNAYRVLHVANGLALVRDDTGIFIVQLNSRLPDGQVIKEMRRQDQKWELVTSGNEIVGETP